jgi:hypothetical protein
MRRYQVDKEQRLEPPYDDWDYGDEEDEDYEDMWPNEDDEEDDDVSDS